MDGETRNAAPSRFQAGALGRAVDSALAGEASALAQPVQELNQFFSECLPVPVASLIAMALERVIDLPRASRKVSATPRGSMLPSWIPARRTLGGFFVLRSLGKGGVGSVFVAKRIEERNDPNAESFALKVPESTRKSRATCRKRTSCRCSRAKRARSSVSRRTRTSRVSSPSIWVCAPSQSW